MFSRIFSVLLVLFFSAAGKAELPSAPVPSLSGSSTPETTDPKMPGTVVTETSVKTPAPSSPGPSSFVLLPHRATYTVSLGENTDEGEDIADAKGQMTIQVAKVGEGWAIEQKATLHIYYKDDTAEQVITTYASYETMDGLKYDFNARTLRGDQEEVISGEAIIPSKGGAGIVTYQEPEESTAQLPVGTIFPTQHLIELMNAATKGKKVISHTVFDGSSETHEPVQVDTFLGAPQDPKLAISDKDLLKTKKVWSMRMAVYAIDSTAPDADYEIIQHVLDLGVIRDMTLDYGTFKVNAVLNQVEVFS